MSLHQPPPVTDTTSTGECPICKSTRYMNPSLRFLVNPECYHKMCESCVDRIFSHGPAQCPIPGCKRTLRKHRFREQTFDDIKVEREVDIRRRVAKVFNRREEEFESLRDYNDYLNDVEDITFNLINNIDVDETTRRFEAYQKAHEKEIEENAQLAEEEKQPQNQVQLKKRMDRQAAAERQRQLQVASEARTGTAGITIKGLKAKQKAEPEPPVDPFGGFRFVDKYFALQNDHVWEGIQDTKKDIRHTAGGYDIADYTHRSLVAAFSGLGVFIADEFTERTKAAQDDEAVGTARADIGLKDAQMVDAA
ncbi:hypothetical protein BAUCODRAFT_64343 [Baudoinia panamericana UAMH 10762]|uniref:RNA polymerase II transcription factor B subunit 3 n=1 Tax=Baudoinia panamericana (strain UAMH 10762) TaxID=717646 RepID=M2NJR4_BAUPA|nr:uncharacterized protein BAUCODRAFT_64343 [Baudoinia panamericana UAMH 10762]EMC99659.1 hypothetical protein BAUCODRAFT_64343 [Baudoinia panamericana UAMH 10762]